MEIIDVQVHTYERDHAGRPWATTPNWPAEVNGEQMVAAMDAVGVDGAILVSSFSMYRFDPSYAVEVYNAFPDKFRVVRPVDPEDPGVEDTIAEWVATDGAVGIRVFLRDEASDDPADPRINKVLACAARHGTPVNLLCWGRLEQVAGLARRNPDTTLVVDHLGILQPRRPPAPPDVWADLPKLLALAPNGNVVVKISGACTMSHEPFPYDDIWEPIGRIIDAFGIERCMWGTDWTRAAAVVTYEEGVKPFLMTDRLSDSDRAALMGGSLRRIYGW